MGTIEENKNPEPAGSGFLILFISDRTRDLTGTHTPGTNIYMAGGTIDDCLHTLHIGLPSPIGTPVRVRNLNAERNALIAELALSHPLHLLAVAYSVPFIGTADMISEKREKCKKNLQKNSRKFKRPVSGNS